MTSLGERLALAEGRTVERLRLRPVALDARLAHATGLWKDERVTLVTRAFEGDAVAWMRSALVQGAQLEIASLAARTRPNRALDPFEAELTWRASRREGAITVWDAERGAMQRRHVSVETLPAAVAEFDDRIDEWVRRAAAMPPEVALAEATRARYDAYVAARAGDGELSRLLGVMFGRAWAEEYVGRVLYPTL